MQQTFYWHDYETWGVDPAMDRPSQFAGIRTDADLNVVGEPLNIMCQPALDTLPRIGAALVTGIDPHDAAAKGMLERDFFRAIHSELAQPGTCGAGYNSLRFDDEVTRYGFYRNFIDPYAREWQSGNSRWDIIDMVRLCYAVRPDGVNWPEDEQGNVTFRLEKLTQANDIEHEGAHDALSDVYATIELARLIKKSQPRLYEHALGFRSKVKVQNALELASYKPKLHISSKFGASFACGSIILPMAVSPANKNEIICIDLRYDPAPLFDLSADQIREYQFTRVEDLPKGIERIPLKSVHLNRSPIVLSPGLVDAGVAEKMKLDLAQVEQHRQQLKGKPGLVQKLLEVFSKPYSFEGERDVDAQLYSGFIPRQDRQVADRVSWASEADLLSQNVAFEDDRLNELYVRYRARNFESSLGQAEQEAWYEFCAAKLITGSANGNIDEELSAISHAREEGKGNAALLNSVERYLIDLRQRLSQYLEA